jgi:hypothetical protein
MSLSQSSFSKRQVYSTGRWLVLVINAQFLDIAHKDVMILYLEMAHDTSHGFLINVDRA